MNSVKCYGRRFFLSLIFCSLGGASANAAVHLQKVKVVSPHQIELGFDAPVKEADVQVDYINDIIQLTFEDANVYPAKISSVNGGDILKVFAYQYSPKVVRTRFTVKGNATDFESRVRVKASGKSLTLKLADSKSKGDGNNLAGTLEKEEERVVQSSSRAVAPSEVSTAQRMGEGAPTKEVAEMQAEESRLLDRVVAATQGSEKGSKEKADSQAQKSNEKSSKNAAETKKGATNPTSSEGFSLQNYILKVVLLISSMALFLVGVLFAFKAISKKKSGVQIASHKGFGNLIDRLGGMGAGLGLGTSGKKKWIEVVANHHLGPKRSIAVVKIGPRQLVLGVTQESINLITDLGTQSSSEALSDAVGKAMMKGGLNSGAADFSDVLEDLAQESILPSKATPRQTQSYSSQPSVSRPAGASAYGNSSPSSAPAAPFQAESARARIRSKLEGLKQL